jgi:hypothetical protein
MSRARAVTRTRSKLLVIAVAGVAGLVQAELIVRFSGLAPVPRPEYTGGVLVPSPDPAIGFENRPLGRLVMRSRASRGAEVVEVVANVNAQGFRGPLVERAKPPGTLRVACLGDSHTFGHGVADGETWPDYLRELCAPLAGGVPVEVMNCGVNALNTRQEVSLLAQRVLAFEPDLVLLQYHLNDAGAREDDPSAEEGGGLVLRWTSPRRGGFVHALRSRSAFADLACDFAYRRAALAAQTQKHAESYGAKSPGWRAAQDALEVTARRLEGRGVPFAVLLYPYLVRRDGVYLSHGAFEEVKATCAARRIPCLDPEAAMLRVPDAELHVHAHDVHGNARANRILAEETAAWLERSGLFAQALARGD